MNGNWRVISWPKCLKVSKREAQMKPWRPRKTWKKKVSKWLGSPKNGKGKCSRACRLQAQTKKVGPWGLRKIGKKNRSANGWTSGKIHPRLFPGSEAFSALVPGVQGSATPPPGRVQGGQGFIRYFPLLRAGIPAPFSIRTHLGRQDLSEGPKASRQPRAVEKKGIGPLRTCPDLGARAFWSLAHYPRQQ